MGKPSTPFVGRAHWQAFKQNSLTWPNEWRAVIMKVEQFNDVLNDRTVYRVWPRNPEYSEYMDKTEEQLMSRRLGDDVFLGPAPPMHLDPIEFDSLDDVAKWAAVAARLSK